MKSEQVVEWTSSLVIEWTSGQVVEWIKWTSGGWGIGDWGIGGLEENKTLSYKEQGFTLLSRPLCRSDPLFYNVFNCRFLHSTRMPPPSWICNAIRP